MCFNMIISTYFISLHSDIADAILICFAQEEELKKRKGEEEDEDFDRKQYEIFDLFEMQHPEIQRLVQISHGLHLPEPEPQA